MTRDTYFDPDGDSEKAIATETPDNRTESEYYARKRALYRKIVDACDGCDLSTAGVVSVLREITERINICRNSKPMQDIMTEMRRSRFYSE